MTGSTFLAVAAGSAATVAASASETSAAALTSTSTLAAPSAFAATASETTAAAFAASSTFTAPASETTATAKASALSFPAAFAFPAAFCSHLDATHCRDRSRKFLLVESTVARFVEVFNHLGRHHRRIEASLLPAFSLRLSFALGLGFSLGRAAGTDLGDGNCGRYRQNCDRCQKGKSTHCKIFPIGDKRSNSDGIASTPPSTPGLMRIQPDYRAFETFYASWG